MLAAHGPFIPAALTPDSSTGTAVAMDLIFIEGFQGETVIGIHDSELHRPQPLVIDIHAGVPRARACDTDCIDHTIDYSVVRERLLGLMQAHGVQLLEAFAEKVADLLLHDFGAAWVRVKVVKPRKFEDVAAVGVQVERRQAPIAAAPSDGAARGAQVLQWLGSGLVPSSRDPNPAA